MNKIEVRSMVSRKVYTPASTLLYSQLGSESYVVGINVMAIVTPVKDILYWRVQSQIARQL